MIITLSLTEPANKVKLYGGNIICDNLESFLNNPTKVIYKSFPEDYRELGYFYSLERDEGSYWSSTHITTLYRNGDSLA